MNPIVAHLVSGQVLFTALPVMMTLILWRESISHAALKRLLTVLACSCCLLGISTAAYPWWLLGMLLVAMAVWSAHRCTAASAKTRSAIVSTPIVLAALIIAIESGWAMRPAVSPIQERSVVVFGDSLSAGLGEREGMPWPDQLRNRNQVYVSNLSEAGATTADGLKYIFQANHFPGLVIVDLGGNDLLGGGSLADFERNLDGILSYLQHRNRSVALVELPLLPGKNAWGLAQRRLSHRYRCSLIPKRLLVDVLATPGSTVDTLHLSQAGHQRLAEQIWSVIEPALPQQ